MKRRAYCESHFMRFVFWQRCSSASVRRSSTEVFRHSSAARLVHKWPLCSSELSWRTWNCKPAGFYCIIPLCVSTASSHHRTNATTPANREPPRPPPKVPKIQILRSDMADYWCICQWQPHPAAGTTPPKGRRSFPDAFVWILSQLPRWKKCTFLQNSFILNKHTSGLNYSALLLTISDHQDRVGVCV